MYMCMYIIVIIIMFAIAAFSRVFTGRTITFRLESGPLHCGWAPINRNGPIDCFQYYYCYYYYIITLGVS